MRNLFFMFFVLVMGLTASAQSTKVIKGAVIDKNGNPLPGATVEATGGSEVTTVDADGTFSMEVPIWLKKATARYAGMRDNTQKVTGRDMLFTMDLRSRRQWYLIANYNYYTHGRYGEHGIGLMTGFLDKWGWYIKPDFYIAPDDAGSDMYFTCSTGVSKRITNQFHAYVGFGAGFMMGDYSYQYVSDDVVLTPEIGFIGNFFNHFTVNVSYSPMYSVDGVVVHKVQVGLGYSF